jgi:hypothetical protein
VKIPHGAIIEVQNGGRLAVSAGFIELHYYDSELPVLVPMFNPDPRWRCTYCAGLRMGDLCEGCGAPRSESPAARSSTPMPQPPGERR